MTVVVQWVKDRIAAVKKLYADRGHKFLGLSFGEKDMNEAYQAGYDAGYDKGKRDEKLVWYEITAAKGTKCPTCGENIPDGNE